MQENNQRKGKVYMEIINFILNIVVILLIFLVGLFTKNYLPSYMDKKGENLATKEDIKEITRKTEEVTNLANIVLTRAIFIRSLLAILLTRTIQNSRSL